MSLGALKVNKSQEDLPELSGFEDKFKDVLRIHGYKKPKQVGKMITQSEILGARDY